MERLKWLVFSFYREEPLIQSKLKPLLRCRMTRDWGNITIECCDIEAVEKLAELIVYLKRPFALLGMGSQIVLIVSGKITRAYPINMKSSSDLLI